MKIEIWSDIMCPFCYVGKRRLETALTQFAHRDELDIVWRSFELDPTMQTKPGQTIHELLAERKGMSVEQGRQMNQHMGQVAREVGLQFDFDKMQPVNTFLGHRFIHLAAHHGKQDEAKERVLAAYFTEGRNVDDLDTLAELGTDIGLDAAEVRATLQTDAYAQDVRHDEYQARQIGVRGVPYFVFDDKYAVSGAQPSELFLEVLDKVWEEKHPAPTVLATGDACGLDGSNC
ncbi:DsbA family oxidoreductase [Hymenobacter cellulosivorans]|uniref:DsbA family oxidoreductase n=1 Tax=Hymenobacter cellulosivorans TaxID=2932249 RepID=A0ABY4FGJ0_9BACT|nr:DsbA family oxidoreductase [Hymenobacter cellulosivorans]UOQ53561.1 DsbA family oxidoreductase [Hymenobacter cellulosivorans]